MERLQRRDSEPETAPEKVIPLWASATYSKELRKSTSETPSVQLENPRASERAAPLPHHIQSGTDSYFASVGCKALGN